MSWSSRTLNTSEAQEWHFPAWDSSVHSTLVQQQFRPYSPCSLYLNITFLLLFFRHIAFYGYVSSAFFFKNRPTPFPFPINWLFFYTKPEVPQSVFVRLFPCGDVWPGPESGPCIPWKMEARSGGWTKFRLNLFWQDCFTEGTVHLACHKEVCTRMSACPIAGMLSLTLG